MIRIVPSYIRKLVTGSRERKRLATNISSLGLLQFFNYFLPLFTVPYLVRVLGPEHFGILALSTATVSYFIILTDYGFNLSATQQVSINRNNPKKINTIFNAVMLAKAVLITLSTVLFSVLVFSIETLRNQWQLYFITYGMVIGQAIFPVWLFQGMENMKPIVILNVLAKIFFTVCIFAFITEKSDFILVPMFTSIGSLGIGVAAIVISIYKFDLSVKISPLHEASSQLRNSWHIFISNISVSLYTTTTIIILGIFTNNSTVGNFSAAERIVTAAKSIFVPISQAIYPISSERFSKNIESGISFVKRALVVVGSLMLLASIILFIFADTAVFLLLGPEFSDAILPLRIMAFVPFFVCVSNFLGVQTMINLNYTKAFSGILFSGAFLGILASILFVPIYSEMASAWITLLIELLISLSMGLYLAAKFVNAK